MLKTTVVLGGTDNYHDLLAGGDAIQKMLIEAGMAARLRVGMEKFAGGWPADDADVFVVNAMAPIFPMEHQRAWAERVAAGTGLVVLHASNVMDGDMDLRDEPETWSRVMGSHFVSHPPFMRFAVKMAGEHPVTAGVGDFEIDDELYITEWTGEPATVLATAEHEGVAQPMVYVREHGKGRICYIALGHDGRCWANPAFVKLVVQATRWAGGAAA